MELMLSEGRILTSYQIILSYKSSEFRLWNSCYLSEDSVYIDLVLHYSVLLRW